MEYASYCRNDPKNNIKVLLKNLMLELKIGYGKVNNGYDNGAFPYLICVCESQTQITKKRIA